MSCQTSCGCLSVEKVKVHSLVYLGGHSAQQCRVFVCFTLHLALWPFPKDKATFFSLWDPITPGLTKWQTLFYLGKGDTWLPKIVYGTQKIKESEDQLYNSFYPSILWIDVFLREVTCCSIHKRQTIREKFTRKDNNILEWKCWACSA